MTTYTIPEPVSGEMHLVGFGCVPFAFDAGDATPATPAEAEILARLAVTGQATVKAASKPEKKAAAPVAPEPEKE